MGFKGTEFLSGLLSLHKIVKSVWYRVNLIEIDCFVTHSKICGKWNCVYQFL